MQRAAGVVAMGGYNTFCEILSFDKKAIIVPRTRPRLEQFIRARAARNVGLIEMLDADRGRDPHAMATALRQLPQQGLPSDVVVPGLLDGLPNVWRLVAKQLAHPHRGPAPLEAIWSRPAPRCAAGRASGARQDLIAGPSCLRQWTRVSRSCSRAGRACPRPSSPRRSPASRRAASRSKSGRCAGRPTSTAIPCMIACRRRVVYLPEYLKDDPRRVWAGWLKARRLPGYATARARLPGRPAARSLGQPAAPLGPGAGAGGRAAGRHRAAVRPFPAYARVGDTLRRPDARPAVERVGACQGHLDQRALGGGGKARRLRLGRDLHATWAPSACARWRRGRTR